MEISLPLARFSSFRSPNKGNRITSGNASSLLTGLLAMKKLLELFNVHRINGDPRYLSSPLRSHNDDNDNDDNVTIKITSRL